MSDLMSRRLKSGDLRLEVADRLVESPETGPERKLDDPCPPPPLPHGEVPPVDVLQSNRPLCGPEVLQKAFAPCRREAGVTQFVWVSEKLLDR